MLGEKPSEARYALAALLAVSDVLVLDVVSDVLVLDDLSLFDDLSCRDGFLPP